LREERSTIGQHARSPGCTVALVRYRPHPPSRVIAARSLPDRYSDRLRRRLHWIGQTTRLRWRL